MPARRSRPPGRPNRSCPLPVHCRRCGADAGLSRLSVVRHATQAVFGEGRTGGADRVRGRATRGSGRPAGRAVRRPGRRSAGPGAGRGGPRPRADLRHQRRQALQVRVARQAPDPSDAAGNRAQRLPSVARSRASADQADVLVASAPPPLDHCSAARCRSPPAQERRCRWEVARRSSRTTLRPSFVPTRRRRRFGPRSWKIFAGPISWLAPMASPPSPVSCESAVRGGRTRTGGDPWRPGRGSPGPCGGRPRSA